MAFTSELGRPQAKLVGSTLVLGLPGSLGIDLTASTPISVAQIAALPEVIDLTATTSITFARTASSGAFLRSASASISFSQTAAPGLLTRTAANVVNISQSGHESTIFELTATTPIVFSLGAAPGLLTKTAHNVLNIEQDIRAGIGLADAIVLTASASISFAHTARRSHVLAAAIQLDGNTTLTFGQSAIFPIELTASNSFDISHNADPSGLGASSSITFSQSAVVNRDFTLTASTSITMSQAFVYQQIRNGQDIAGTVCSLIKSYKPLIGSGGGNLPTPPRTVVPPRNKQSTVVWFYPSLSQCSATSVVTLRTPNFGDRDRQAFDIINRESRGGTLQVFRDANWPEVRTLVMDFSGLKETEADDILTFLTLTAGREVGFRDWWGRTWRGIIQTPDSPIIRTRDDNIDLAMEIEVTSQILEVDACTEIILSQPLVDVVKV